MVLLDFTLVDFYTASNAVLIYRALFSWQKSPFTCFASRLEKSVITSHKTIRQQSFQSDLSDAASLSTRPFSPLWTPIHLVWCNHYNLKKGSLLQCSVISGFVKLKQVNGSRDVTGKYKQAAQTETELTGLFTYRMKYQETHREGVFIIRIFIFDVMKVFACV